MNLNVMVDIETLSTRPNAMVLSIGAVLFDETYVSDGSVLITFGSSALKEQKRLGRDIDPDTVMWWMGQGHQARDALTAQGDVVGLKEGLLGFEQYLHIAGHGSAKNLTLWSMGSDFDLVILRTLYEDAGLLCPFTHRQTACHRTLRHLYPHVTVEKPATFIAHNAMHDAVQQARLASKILGIIHGKQA